MSLFNERNIVFFDNEDIKIVNFLVLCKVVIVIPKYDTASTTRFNLLVGSLKHENIQIYTIPNLLCFYGG